jgi:Zn-dependent protease with chaperone function
MSANREKLPLTPAALAERVSFFDEQARRRNQATWWAWLTGTIGLSICWCFGILVVLAVFFYTLLLTRLFPRSIERMFDLAVDHAGGATGAAVAATFFTAGLWYFVQRIFVCDSSAGLVARIGARLPNPLDPEEKQLVNIADEMAIAATMPAPAVMLFDGPNINAAAVGEKPTTARILVSREMLNRLNRDETQGVVGHLLASVANGDLRLMGAMLRAFYLMGLAVTLLDLPFSSQSRRAIALLWRYVTRSPALGVVPGSEEVGEALTTSLQPEALATLAAFMQKFLGEKSGARQVVGALLLFPLLPLIMMRLAAGIVYGLASLFVLGPLVALVLRSRRRLADATAVQLTRNPDGLGSALVHLYRLAHAIPNAGWSEMAFIVGGEAADARQLDRFQDRVAEIKSSAVDLQERVRQTSTVVASLASSARTENVAARHNFIFGFHPSLGSRIVQLQRMGATSVQWVERKDYSGWILASVISVVVGGVLLLILASQRAAP